MRATVKKPYLGPRTASYAIRLDGKSNAATLHRTREGAYNELEHWRCEGRTADLTRTEHCPEPGCDGRGKIAYRPRGWKIGYEYRDCPYHQPLAELVEATT